MKTRVIHTRFWKDNYVTSLNRLNRYIFVYLITNEKVNMCGMYELPDREIKFDLDVTQSELDAAKKAFSDAGKIFFHEGWVKIMNIDKYNSYSGEKNDKAREKELALVPDSLKGIHTSIDTSMEGVYIPTRNQKSEISNELGEYEGEEDYLPLWKEVMGTKIWRDLPENVRAGKRLAKHFNPDQFRNLLFAVKMIRADKYQKRSLQDSLTNLIGLEKNVEKVEAYMASRVDQAHKSNVITI